MVKQRFLAIFAFLASIFALTVIGLGAFTRLIDAGLGCPDWPGCYGHFIVSSVDNIDTYKAWAEMIHRYFAGILGILILGIVGLVFSKKLRFRSNVILAICLLLLLAYQIVLGQWTVTLKLLPIVVTQHLLGGFLILSVLWLIYLNNSVRKIVTQRLEGRFLIVFASIALIILFIQITLGAWTSTNYAALSCPDFPFCMNEHPLPTLYFEKAFNLFSPIGLNYEGGILPGAIRQTIQMTHRFGALIFTVYLLIYTAVAIPKLKKHPNLLKSIHIIWGILCIQLCIGMTNVIFKLPLGTAIGHNLVAVGLLLSMITFVYNLVIASKKVSAL